LISNFALELFSL